MSEHQPGSHQAVLEPLSAAEMEALLAQIRDYAETYRLVGVLGIFDVNDLRRSA